MCRKYDDMANKWFKIFSAAGLLLVYLSVMVASNMSLMLCDCHSHHHHSHMAVEHRCSCGECHALKFGDASVDKKCGCSHDHSTDVDLYTFSRSWNDDTAERFLLMPALVTACVDCENEVVATIIEYDRYLLPPQSGVEKGSAVLRAPPALV